MNSLAFLWSPEKIKGRFLTNLLLPGLPAGARNMFGMGFPGELPPPPPPPPGNPPPPPGSLQLPELWWRHTGNPLPGKGWGQSGQSGSIVRNVAMSSLVYMCPVLGLIDPTWIIWVVCMVWLMGVLSMWSAAASLTMSCIAGDSRIQMTLGWLLASDGVLFLDGVVSSWTWSPQYGICCAARCQSMSSDVMLSPKSSAAIQYASQCPPTSKFSTQCISNQQTCGWMNSTG